MRNPRDMTDAEIVAHLRFTKAWFRLGVIDEETLRITVTHYRESDDPHDEHWRYRAFRSFLEQHPTLTAEQCEGLFDLGATDPDFSMGQAIMRAVLGRKECPQSLPARAATCPRRHAANDAHH